MSNLKASPFYTISEDITKNPTGMIIDNEEELKGLGARPLMPLDTRIRGFSHFVPGVRPRLRYDRKSGRLPKDLETIQGCWLITHRLKEIFEHADNSAFEFIECNLVEQEQTSGMRFWLCDVIRIVDAVDEERSKIKIFYMGPSRRKYYTVQSTGYFVLKDRKKMQDNSIFRVQFSESQVIVHASVRASIKHQKIQGVSFSQTYIDPIRSSVDAFHLGDIS